MTPERAKAYLDKISERGMNPGLERMKTLMSLTGHPEKKFKSIHLTGTNGKGSTSAMLESVLRSSGIRTGLYTSPHILDLTERIGIAGRPISWRSLAAWIGKIREIAGRMEKDLTYFETVTAAAFCAFAQERVELAVVEVGLGGRFDATNVLPAPIIAVITNISLEHTQYLGKSLRSIAWEKAHIVKKGSVCVTGASGAAFPPIRAACRRAGARIYAVKRSSSKTWEKFRPALRGDFQRANLALALKTLEVLRKKGWDIPRKAVSDGLKDVRWPGRFQTEKFKGRTVLMDGAHNPGAMKALTAALRGASFSKRPCLLAFNALNDKNIAEMAGDLMKNLAVKRVLIPRLASSRSSDPEETRRIFLRARPDLATDTYASVKDLWTGLGKMNIPRTDWILASGSFHMVGETLRALR
ncbi:MAG: hypothetical protein A3A86_00460 [Elusimicrobia bacterium RIFCSPLOWO2_01_FULL_60_11]|nr:MAG: hypothetical protein A3A86_00460 [Elusimicrobia bacterium RIFCSPLOWO2_01_FULL_60_11]